MSLSRRLQVLEAKLGTNNEPAVIIAVKDTDRETALERAKTEYKERHPDWLGDVSLVVWVSSQDTKDDLYQTIARLSEG